MKSPRKVPSTVNSPLWVFICTRELQAHPIQVRVESASPNRSSGEDGEVTKTSMVGIGGVEASCAGMEEYSGLGIDLRVVG